MEPAPIPEDDAQRLAALQSLAIVDSPPEERFDRVTRVASDLFEAPIALFSLIDADRQWFKSRTGVEATELPRSISVCGHTIAGSEMLVIPDALEDPRFADNPLVTDYPQLRFYAGYPVRTPDGHAVGTLCVLDTEPREFDDKERASLADLGAMVEQELASRALARSDPLTGLLNRRGFEAMAEHALAVAAREHLSTSLVFIDLDGFKEVNDEYGHAEGDLALQELARILETAFRSSDVVARVGGDEFCVLLTGTDDAEVRDPVERLRTMVQRRNEAPESRFDIVYSTGIVSFDGNLAPTLSDVVAEADRRMYEDKRRRGGTTTQRELAQVLLLLAGSLTTDDSYDVRMTKLCEETVRLLACDRASIFPREGDHYRAGFNYGNPPDMAELFPLFRAPLDDPLVRAAVESRRFVAVDDAANSPLMDAGVARRARIRSLVVAPLMSGNDPIGFMTAEYNERGGVFSDLDATLLQGIARIAAGAMQAARSPAVQAAR